MRYATVCSGIEAPSLAWEGLGWKPVWFSEIEGFPSAALAHHYSQTPNLGDMTKIHEDERYKASIGTIDVFCGGTPCQSFSVAGLRKGMADPRGNLALHFLRIANEIRPRWIVWENVPGILSSNRGKDFGSFLGAMGQLGYGWAYRVLDAQYFGLAQRRKRVFVVGYLGDWRCAAAVLFDTESLSGNPAPSREKGKGVARTLTASTGGSSAKEQQHTFIGVEGNPLNALDNQRRVAAYGGNFSGEIEVSTTLMADNLRGDFESETFVIKGAAIGRNPEAGPESGNQGGDFVQTKKTVRRLTLTECERLQGFPDGYTDMPGWKTNKPEKYGGHGTPDGPRYRAIGNSMAVPVMKWIGERIQMVDKIENE